MTPLLLAPRMVALRHVLLTMLIACQLMACRSSRGLEPSPPFMGKATAIQIKYMESTWTLLSSKDLPDFSEAWRSYLAFFEHEMRPAFTWMLPTRRKGYNQGFQDGAQMAFALREQSPGSELITATMMNQHKLSLLDRRNQAYQMGFMAALEKASVLELQRPVHLLGSLKLRPPEVCLPEAPRFTPSDGQIDYMDLLYCRPSPKDSPQVLAQKGQRRTFLQAKRLRVQPHWGSYLGSRQQSYESGFQSGVMFWARHPFSCMTPELGHDLLKSAVRDRPLPYHLGFMAGMEAGGAFEVQVERLSVRVLSPARTVSELPFQTEFLAFVPESLPLPSEAEMKGRTLLEIVGLQRIEACLVLFNRDAENVRQTLAKARFLGREKDIPLSLTLGTRGYLRCYDGRTMPFRVHGPWLLAGGWCFGPK